MLEFSTKQRTLKLKQNFGLNIGFIMKLLKFLSRQTLLKSTLQLVSEASPYFGNTENVGHLLLMDEQQHRFGSPT